MLTAITAATARQRRRDVPTWGWFLLGWIAGVLIVAPVLGKHFHEVDDDWP